MVRFKGQKQNNNYVLPMSLKERQKLQAKSLLAFGRKNHYKTIMRRGRVVTDNNGKFVKTEIITPQEIEDTMDYILKEREEKQKAILEEMNELRKKTNS
jgi:hypothetical protein